VTTDEQGWRVSIYTQMLQAAHGFERENFDAVRFHGIDPGSFFLQDHANYHAHFGRHAADFHAARNLLVDEQSRDLFDKLILYRMLGHLHVRLPLSNPASLAKMQVPEDWKISEGEDGGMFGPMCVFDVPVGESSVWVKAWAVNVSAYLARQYYFEREGVRIAPEVGDYIVDAGGCFGDTALLFAHHVGPTGRVYTFDPLKKHCSIMREAISLNSTLEQRITVFESGLADVDQVGIGVDTGEAINPGARVGADSGLPLRTIDSVAAEGALPRVDFVKMDIEGSELAALKGGEKSIRQWRPRLAISLYHRPEDFFAIPLWIDSLGLGYRFYLDHYSIHQEETVLYAVAPT
jgi:FkbM family methyltransferase